MLSTRTEFSDAELITAVRGGDVEAYGELFDRHRDAAMRMANQLVYGPDADDLVAESFVRVLTTLQRGKGPDESFRAYLLTSIRRLHIDRGRAGKKVRTTDDEAELDRAVEFIDPAEMRFETSTAAAAFASLPERWQLVLWHLDVEGQKPAEIAPLLGMSANSVSALAYRAREGLRQAYLQGHLAPSLHDQCRDTTRMLGSYVRRGLSSRDTATVERHLDECSRCTGLYLELSEVNANLSAVLGPALLGTAFGGYAAATGAAGAAAGALGATGLKLFASQAVKVVVEPFKSLGSAVAGAGTQGVVAATVVASVATAGTVAVTTDFGSSAQNRPQAAAPAVTSPAPSPAPSVSPSPTPDEPDPEPEPDPAPAPGPSAEPEAEPDAEPPAEPVPAPVPEPATPAATDYSIARVTITNDASLLQRRFTINVGAHNATQAAAQRVSLTMDFTSPVRFRGVVSPGWDCGPAQRNDIVRSITCTKELPAGEGTTFIVKARGVRPGGTVTVTGAGDPVASNNSRSFQSGPYLLVL